MFENLFIFINQNTVNSCAGHLNKQNGPNFIQIDSVEPEINCPQYQKMSFREKRILSLEKRISCVYFSGLEWL